ncbi:hypothetical protein RUMHYD_00052 [Blautia hydrogenotrophica DSM 10507]|uniref:Uncharacterized protein n=1 Tax=Blautia hydrogenotrophica (strain DSM 10507 / JCM 14656 / S5a33) TaxID=476272 RepID=C0CGT9_BLAHS|nr:hypothetical protein RUMHYD_00052 [Blautia hydrogenotrophica DSM 10507]
MRRRAKRDCASQDREDGRAEVGLPTLFCYRKDLATLMQESPFL